MITRKTVVDQIEVNRDNRVYVRFGVLLLEDGVEVECKWHRTVIEPGTDPDLQIRLVNAHLKSMSRAPVDEAGLGRLRDIVKSTHTPEVVAAFKAQMAELAKAATP